MDAGSFDEFYARSYRSALKLAVLLVGDLGHAADLTQDAFADAYRSWDRIGRYDRPDLWIRRAVINRSRSVWRRPRTESDALARLGVAAPLAGVPDAIEVGVWRLVARLPRRQAQALALVYGMDMSVADAAELMGCSDGSVKTHLSRAREALAVLIDREEADE